MQPDTPLGNDANDVWACDFLPIADLFFRPRYACCVSALATRRVVHVGVTRHPSDAWVAQQRRESTAFGQRPTYLLRDNDSTYGSAFARVVAATGSTELRTVYRTPRQHAAARGASAAGGGSAAISSWSRANTSRTSTTTARTRGWGRASSRAMAATRA